MSARPVLTRKPGVCPFDGSECIRTMTCGYTSKSEACINYEQARRDNSYAETCKNCRRRSIGCAFFCIRRDFQRKIRNEGKP